MQSMPKFDNCCGPIYPFIHLKSHISSFFNKLTLASDALEHIFEVFCHPKIHLNLGFWHVNKLLCFNPAQNRLSEVEHPVQDNQPHFWPESPFLTKDRKGLITWLPHLIILWCEICKEWFCSHRLSQKRISTIRCEIINLWHVRNL